MFSRIQENVSQNNCLCTVRDQLNRIPYGCERTLAIFCPDAPEKLKETIQELNCILMPLKECRLDCVDWDIGNPWKAIDYAISSGRVSEIVLFGNTELPSPKVGRSRCSHEDVYERLVRGVTIYRQRLHEAEQHVVTELQRLKDHPTVAAAVMEAAIEVHGLIYHSETGIVQRYCEETGRFVSLD